MIRPLALALLYFACSITEIQPWSSHAEANDQLARPSHPSDPVTTSWRESFQCGPNALYLFLRLHEQKIDLGDVRRLVPINDSRGCSFESLKLASRKLGFPAELIRTDLEELKRTTLPVIVHHDSLYGSNGHYYVVVSVADRTADGQPCVRVIDPIGTNEVQITTDEFLRYWTASALVPGRPRVGRSSILSFVGLAMFATGVIIAGFQVIRRSNRAHSRHKDKVGAESSSVN